MTATLLVAAACSEPRAESPATPSTEASPSGQDGLMYVVGDIDHPGFTVDAPEGWSRSDDGHFMVKDGPEALGMSVWDVGGVPRHPCRWKGTETDAGSTVDDLVGLLASQPLRGGPEPIPVTLAGYSGQYLELSVPDDVVVTGDSDFEGCDRQQNGHRDFVSWWGTQGGERYHQAAGQVDRVWVLDVDGQTLLVDATYTPDTSVSDREELEQVVQSLQFVEA